MLHAPDLDFCYLEYLSAAPGATSGGIGSALYERVRLAALVLGAIGLFLESLPDDPSLFLHPVIRKQNAARLRFYERYGARPIAGTAYETPLTLGDDNPPYSVFDGTFVQNNFARTPDVWKGNQNLTFLVQNA